ncbi:MAG: adenylate/guanylate cyclase domain-containing protein [Gammaproteobacteria bacterium]
MFFSAMAEFSALMVKLPPERVTALLARSLDEFTRMIHRYGGTIDNYLGESIMAFWGAPVSVADGPQRACRAALQCVRVERELRRKDPKSFPTATRNLFAIHRGPAIVGNIGSSARMAYTAIGDSVEFAWNLRQLNHRYGTRIIVSEPVHAVVAEQFWLRRLDVIHLQGRSEGLPIYELLGERSEALANDVHEFVRSYEAGLEALEAAAWHEATPIFERLAEARPADPSVKLMRLRCSMRDTAICPRLTASGAEVPNEAAVG